MKIKDKQAFIIYILLTVVLWQFLISVSKIIKSNIVTLGFIDITETINTGAAFGMLKNNSFYFAIFGVIALILISFYVCKNIKFEDKTKLLYISIFSAGILGNTYERITNGFVSDFIKINIFNFPIFNMFDILISLSCILYGFFYIKELILKRMER